MLLHINGLPGAGKSSLAREWARRRPLALVVEVDLLRTQLGGWNDAPESRLVARDLAIALVEAHLQAGHDVVVPQFLGRTDFIERLEAAARAADADFSEVLLELDSASARERFRQRRRTLVPGTHPEHDVPEEEIDSTIADAATALTEVLGSRTRIRVVDGSGSVEETLQAITRLA